MDTSTVAPHSAMAAPPVDCLIRLYPSPAMKAAPGAQTSPTVCGLTGLCPSSIYNLIRRGAFPPSRKIAGSAARRWRLSEVQGWIDAQSVNAGRRPYVPAKGGAHA